MSNTIEVFKCLSDKSRLNILNLLIKKPMYVELISKSLKLAASTVSFHLKKLEKAGLVRSEKDQYYTMYYVNESVFNQKLIELILVENKDSKSQEKRQDEYHQKVLDAFFENNKIKQIPVQRKKRIIILKEIAKSFELSKKYTENEVNEIILKFHDDYCFIRREFIMEKLFVRDNGIYQKLTFEDSKE
ncbi:ArsR family transcriptional regulator [Candidatus Izimaplasma bacterium ZiA1]|uniref:DUF2087 domain-containing protein n=1 Tax=Candidatus Izimoplasma sp. ZiA1 TaxID=2024899 RepID=UPI000BAA65DB|nr:ArsR family transcriptional regulator [Candidatus Izimaplasma bacterium ZiA1]